MMCHYSVVTICFECFYSVALSDATMSHHLFATPVELVHVQDPSHMIPSRSMATRASILEEPLIKYYHHVRT